MSEHALLLHFALDDGGFGSGADRDAVRGLGREVEAAAASSGTSALDGDSFGAGEATLYLYGPDAGALLTAVEPLLRRGPVRPDRAVLRYGSGNDPAAAERQIVF